MCGNCGRQSCAPMWSCLRILENVPIIGHLVASIYGCCGLKDEAERAGIKASVGLLCAACNIPAETVDEVVRYRSAKLYSDSLSPRPDWMRKYPRRTIRQLCLPGSHQSGTYHMHHKLQQVPMIEGWSKCQNLTIADQLHGGVRFLDLRLMTDEKTKEIWLHHNVVVCIKFKEVLETVRDFVAEYPTEIVGLYMTNDGKDLDWTTVHSFINEYLGEKLIDEGMANMSIGDIVDNGKNVIMFGAAGSVYTWRTFEYRWPNKAWPEELEKDLRTTLDNLAGLTPFKLYWYKAECTVNAVGITRAIGGLPGVAVAPRADEKYEFLESLAGAVNQRVKNVLSEVTRMPFNVLSIDFVHDDIVSRIIELNDNDETGGLQSISSVPTTPSVSPHTSMLDNPDQSAPALVVDMAIPPATPLLEVWESSM